MENLNLDANMNHTNRVRAWLGKLPGKEIEFESIGPIVKEIGLEYSQVRSTLKYLEELGEIKIKREITPGGRQFMRGIELIKMTSSNEVITQTAEKMKRDMPPADFRVDEDKIPGLTAYLKQKVVVSQAAEMLRSVGLDNAASDLMDSAIEEDEFFGEGIYLLQQIEFLVMNLSSISKQRDDAVIDMQEEREKANYWKSKINTLPETQRTKFEEGAPWIRSND